MRKSLLAFASSAFLLSACSLDDALRVGTGDTRTTEEQVVEGLRVALSLGIDSGADIAGKVNGYLGNAALKILLPEDAAQALASAKLAGAYLRPYAKDLQAVNSTVQALNVNPGSFSDNLRRASSALDEAASLEHLGDSLIKYMNRAAEYAAPRSVPVFQSAITSMTIADGLSLLDSPDSTAATAYLDGKTFDPLTRAYAPIVDSTLALVPLTQYWGDFRKTYNALLENYQSLLSFQAAWNRDPIVSSYPSLQVDALESVDYQPIQTESLGTWTTQKALAGLFHLVGEQEKRIRRDPFGYAAGLAAEAAEVLKKVFGDIMKMAPPSGP